MDVREALYNQVIQSLRRDPEWSLYLRQLLQLSNFELEDDLLVGGSSHEIVLEIKEPTFTLAVDSGKLVYWIKYTFIEGVKYTAETIPFWYNGSEQQTIEYSGGRVFIKYPATGIFKFSIDRVSGLLVADLDYSKYPREMPFTLGSWKSLFLAVKLYNYNMTVLEPAVVITEYHVGNLMDYGVLQCRDIFDSTKWYQQRAVYLPDMRDCDLKRVKVNGSLLNTFQFSDGLLTFTDDIGEIEDVIVVLNVVHPVSPPSNSAYWAFLLDNVRIDEIDNAIRKTVPYNVRYETQYTNEAIISD